MHRMRPTCAALAVAACLLLVSPASGTIMRPLNIEELTSRATRIVVGRCLEVQALDLGLGSRPLKAHQIRFRVQQVLKGEVGTELVIRQLDTAALIGREDPSGGPSHFTVGEQVVLFLYGDSTLGLTSTVGFGQGKFTVLKDERGATRVRNGWQNLRLLERLSPIARSRLAQLPEGMDGPDRLSVERLVAMVRQLTEPGDLGASPAPRGARGERP